MIRYKGKEVVVLYPASIPWMAMCLQGIAAYAQEKGGWKLQTSPPTLDSSDEIALTPSSLRDWHGNGVIAAIDDRVAMRAACRLSIPVVNLSGWHRRSQLPRVMVDHRAIGRIAAEHLLACRMQRLAYCGLQGRWYSYERQQGFVERASKAGVSCEIFEMSPCTNPRRSWRQRTAPLTQWLSRLSTPIGILAVHDYRARMLMDECLRLGLDVPHDVAVLGVDNDRTICELGIPALSSVSRSPWKVGYEAAALLDRLMAGRSAPDWDVLIPPDGVIARRSTDTIVAEDPYVREAIQFMHDHLSEPFGINRVVEQVTISRRLLEKHFRSCLHCSPCIFLQNLRLEHAKQLIKESEKRKLGSIARQCGFVSPKSFRIAFQRAINMSPQEYRKSIRNLGEPRRSSRARE